MNAQTKLAKAKTSLVLDHPFFGTLALNMPAHIHPSQWFEERNMPPTAAVSYDDMHFCEDFIEELTDNELMFVVAHEVMHPALEHPSRVQSRDRYDWNVAGDYVINQLLTDSRVGSMPKDGLLDSNIYNSGEGVTDKIYNIVHNDKQDGDGEGQGKPLDTIMESEGGTPAEAEAKASEWKVKIVQAAQAAKMMGKLPSSIERLVG
jgi:predicted metal-dependent peptidase